MKEKKAYFRFNQYVVAFSTPSHHLATGTSDEKSSHSLTNSEATIKLSPSTHYFKVTEYDMPNLLDSVWVVFTRRDTRAEMQKPGEDVRRQWVACCPKGGRQHGT